MSSTASTSSVHRHDASEHDLANDAGLARSPLPGHSTDWVSALEALNDLIILADAAGTIHSVSCTIPGLEDVVPRFAQGHLRDLLRAGHDLSEDIDALVSRIQHSDSSFQMALRTAAGTSVTLDARSTVVEECQDHGRVTVLTGHVLAHGERNLNQLLSQRNLAIALSSADTLEDGLRTLLEATLDAAGAECGFAFAVSDGVYSCPIAIGFGGDEDTMSLPLTLGNPQDRKAVMEGKPYYHQHDTPSDCRSDHVDETMLLALVPVVHEGRTVACLNLASRSKTALRIDEMQAVQSLTASASAAIQRLRLRADAAAAQRPIDAAIAASPAIIAIVQGTTIVYVNQFAAAMTGFSVSELVGTDIRQIVHPDDKDFAIAQALLKQDRPANEGDSVIVRLATKSGQFRWAEIEGRLVHHDGMPAALLVGIDVTKRREAELSSLESTQILRGFIDASLDGIVIVDQEGKIVEWSPAAQRILTTLPGNRRGCHIWDVQFDALTPKQQTEEKRQQMRDIVKAYLKGGSTPHENQIIQHVSKDREGRTLHVQELNFPIDTPRGRWIGAIYRDVTREVNAEIEIGRQNEYLKALQETSLAVLNQLDIDQVLASIIKRAAALVGTTHGFVSLVALDGLSSRVEIGLGHFGDQVGFESRIGDGLAGQVLETRAPVVVNDFLNWSKRIAGPSPLIARAALALPLKRGNTVTGVIALAFAEQGRLFTDLEVNILTSFAELASIALENARLFSLSQQELAERRIAEEALRHLSYFDQLTNLRNRRYFEQQLKRDRPEEDYPLTMASIDMDGLKLINDALGHAVGDEMIAALAGILRDTLRPYDLPCRVGGDEFVILMPHTPEEEARAITEVVERVIAKYNAGKDKFPLSISIGLATANSSEDCLADIFKTADQRMYEDKFGRTALHRVGIVAALTRALGAKDYLAEGHIERVRTLAIDLGKEIGLSAKDLSKLEMLAQVHDLGKVGVPDDILFKPGQLSDAEFARMKQHAVIGYGIAMASPELAQVADLILHHHER